MGVASKASALVSTGWLQQRLQHGCKRLRLLDASWYASKDGEPDYHKKHIPGALFYNTHQCVRPTPHIPRNLPEIRCYSEYLHSLGINEDSHVVLYDRNAMRSAARGWWTLRLHGHPQVSVLHGGLIQWEREGHEITDQPSDNPKRGNFQVNFQPSLLRHYENVESNVRSHKEQLLDVRKCKAFSGEVEEPTASTMKALEFYQQPTPTSMSRGCVPGSLNLHVDSVYADQEKVFFKRPEEMELLFRDAGVDLTRPLVTSCVTGMTACVMALAAASVGKTDAAVYPGSWTEWAQRTSQDKCLVHHNQRTGG